MPAKRKTTRAKAPMMLRRRYGVTQRPLLAAVLLFAVTATGVTIYRISSAADVGNADTRQFLDPTAMAAERAKLPTTVPQPKTNCDLFDYAGLCHGRGLATGTSMPSPSPGLDAGTAASSDSLDADTTGIPCTSNNCGPLIYQGGPVQHSPNVIFVEWGPKWTHDTLLGPTVQKFMGALGNEVSSSAPDRWSTTTSQYGDSTGAPWFYVGINPKVVVDTTTPPQGCDQGCIANEAIAVLNKQGVKPGNWLNYQVAVATQSGACPKNFPGNGCPPPDAGAGFCSYHVYAIDNIGGTYYYPPFINLPWLPDSPGCDGSGSGLTVQQDYTAAFGHEYAETITDPNMNAWANTNGGGEVGDECPGWKTINTVNGPLTEQSLYSNAAMGCVYNSGVQGSVIGLAGKCVDDAYSSVANGNKIDLWDCNHSNAQALTYMADHSLRVQGRCLNDNNTGGSGSSVILYKCFGAANEIWTYDSTTKEYVLKANGLCLNVKGNNPTNGTPLVMFACNGAANEQWTKPKATL